MSIPRVVRVTDSNMIEYGRPEDCVIQIPSVWLFVLGRLDRVGHSLGLQKAGSESQSMQKLTTFDARLALGTFAVCTLLDS